MFGLSFLFAAALWALPVAGLPLLLHLLFRRKSPVVYFPTLRFIKSSIQRTAARRRIHRWILLSCRMGLLLLLIWAIAQPVRILATTWGSGGQSTVAAIVVDTSYSMLLKQQDQTLLERADQIVQGLLREPLRDSRIAIFRSSPPPQDTPEQVEPAAKILGEWTALKPQPALEPLSQRITSAAEFLSRQHANQKWLVVLSDLQSREFPRPISPAEGYRTIFFDLHPEKPRSYGITSVKVEPDQPIPGVGTQVVVEVTGPAGASRAVTVQVNKLSGANLNTIAPLMAVFDEGGRTRIRAPLPQGLPAEKYLLVGAKLEDDDLMWDNARWQLVELPERRVVTLIEAPSQPTASAFIRLALDPWEGRVSSWPLDVRRGTAPSGQEQVIVMVITQWPSEAQAVQLREFVRGGGTVIWFLQPGIEQSFENLPKTQQSVLLELLPAAAAPATSGSGLFRPVAPARPDRILEGLTDPSFRLDQLNVRRFVPFLPVTDPNVGTLLYLSPANADGGRPTFGMLYRRSIGNGTLFTCATLPEGRYLTPPAHPLLLPLLVTMSLPTGQQRDAVNVELGRALVLTAPQYTKDEELEIEGPAAARYRVKAGQEATSRRFTFERTMEPGVYYWRRPGETREAAVANVQLPAAESDLIYRPAESVVTPGPNCLIVRSMADLTAKMAKVNEPQPRWTWPIAIVLLLFCVEALLGSLSQLPRATAVNKERF